MISDSPALRDLLAALLPGLMIDRSPSPSGQRVVYFGSFSNPSRPPGRDKWGPVVVKVSEGISAGQIAYLEKEIEILNSLKSRHYPRLLFNETFTEDPRTSDKLSRHLFVTIEECIDAKPLSALMGNFRTERQVIKLLLGLIEALEPLWVHPLKLVHRDLKPDNILIRNTGEIVIIDLGIVREEGAKGVTLTFSPFGPCTPLYASPEQAKNDKRNISFRSDFFSLGALAYELMTGSPPFGPANLHYTEVLDKVVTLKVPSLDSVCECSPRFAAIVSRMMEKEPYRRHRSVGLLKADILSLIQHI